MVVNEHCDGTFVKDNMNRNQNVVGIEDRTFSLSFGVIKVSGLWKPTNINVPLGFVYDIYTLFSFISMVILIVTILLDNAASEQTMVAVIQNLYLILTVLNAISKGSTVYLRRGKVISILQKYMEDRWMARNEEEMQVINKSVYSERYITRFCIYLVTANNLSSTLGPLVHPVPEHDLMVDAYSPCERSKAGCFWFSYLLQVFGYVSASLVNVGCDCILFNLIERVCAQLSILELRTLELPGLVEVGSCKEVDYLKERVKDHHSIYRLIKLLNSTFYEIVFVQFVTSISILCTNVYLLSMQPLFSAEFIALSVYLCCAFVENFFYCWYGYKISVYNLHMSDAIFNMNWCILQKESKQMLSYVMFQTSQKINLFNSAVVSLTPETFVKILKVSYSAFNILQQTAKK